MQNRDFGNGCNLISEIRRNLPNHPIYVFYSGFIEDSEASNLKKVCSSNNAFLWLDSKPQTIGTAARHIARCIDTSWIIFCDSDTMPTSQSFELWRAGIAGVPDGVKAIQCYNLPQENANAWARFDSLGDTMPFVRDRSAPVAWFAREKIIVPESKLITTLHGGILIVERETFQELGGFDDDTLLAHRGYAGKLHKSKHLIWFNKKNDFYHIYPTSLWGVVYRKILHAKGSALNRIRYPELYKDSSRIRISMFLRAFFPPRDFSGIYGRTYFFCTMMAFTATLSLYLYKFGNKDKVN